MMQLAIQAGFHRGEDVFALAADGLELADRTRSHPAELIFMLALAGAAFDAGDDDVAMVLDGALRPEWAALAAVMPAAALEHYEQIVARRRSVDPDVDGSTTATIWPDALAAACRYAEAGGSTTAEVETHGPALTDREREVLGEIAAGRTNKEIAAELGLRPKTVMHHCASIYRKLGVKNRAEAATTALRFGLLDDHR